MADDAAAPPPSSPSLDPEPLPLCASEDLAERGHALGFDVLEHGRPVRAFALRFEGRVVAYLNRCAHVPVEMDWNPGDFLDPDRAFILCSIHGAHYHPADGRCAGGPCRGGRLRALNVVEREGRVGWYPSRDIHPAPATPSAAHAVAPNSDPPLPPPP